LTDEPAGNDSGDEEPMFEEQSRIDMETVVKPEDKFKLSLLNIQKRFVDIEFAISEIAARVKDIDPENLKTLDQRIESLEDMIMVEQAGVHELKHIMQNVDNVFQTTATLRDVEDMRERVRRVENLARAAAEMTDLPAELSQETRQRIKSVEDNVAELMDKSVEVVSPMEVAEMRRSLGNLDERVSLMRMSVEDLKRNIDKRVQDGIKGAQITTADFGFISTKINSLKTAIDILSDKRIENEMKITALEQRLANVHAGEGGDSPLSEKMIDELRTMKRDVEGAKLRMDSVERVVQETAKTAHDAEAASRRFEGFEKLSGLQAEIDDKLRQFRFVQDELGRLSNRIEMMYEGVEKRFSELRGAEREMHNLGKAVADARKEIEMTKFGLKRAASKEDVAGLAAEVGGARRLEGRVEELGEAVRKLDAAYGRESQGGVSAEVLVIMKEMADRLENAERTIIDMQTGAGAPPAVPGQLGMQDFEGRMNDVIDKLVFLESRLSALEAIFQTSSRTQAVVIE